MPESEYFAEIGDLREKMRVEDQAIFLDRDIDPLAGEDLSHVRDVLGIACGTGSWLIQYAQQYPESRVTGLDIDEGMLDFAQAKARVAGVTIDFQRANALEPLKFPDASFDLVHMRMAIGFMHRSAWPSLLAEYIRILRPGGLVVLTEAEDTATNDYLYEQYGSIICTAFHNAGHSFAGDTRQAHLCLSIALPKLLEEAGFTNVRHAGHDINFSFGKEAHTPVLENVASAFENGKPFFVTFGGVTSEQVDEAICHINSLMNKPGFLGYWHFISSIGYKALIILFCLSLCCNTLIELFGILV